MGVNLTLCTLSILNLPGETTSIGEGEIEEEEEDEEKEGPLPEGERETKEVGAEEEEEEEEVATPKLFVCHFALGSFSPKPVE